MKRALTPNDILSPQAYEAIRAEKRAAIIAQKRDRRIAVGPYATFYFENYDTMWLQVQEMLRIEKGGDEQLVDELRAYNPMIPNGHELTATVMFEIEDPTRRATVLGSLGGVEHTLELRFAGHVVKGKAEQDLDYTSEEGKASSVQFVHFLFTAEQIMAFRAAAEIILAVTHPHYAHMAVLPSAAKQSLCGDFLG